MTLYIIILISLVTITISLIILHKAKRIHTFQFDLKQQQINQTENLYKQLEALIGLYQTLPLTNALPPLRGWAGSPDYLLELALQTLEKRPSIVLECGSGSSSLVIGACLKKINQGHCYSLDHDPVFAQKTRNLIASQGLTDWVTVIDAPLIPYQIEGKTWDWYDISKLNIKNIDLLNIDGPPMDTNPLARYPALPILKEYLAKSCLLFLDDASREDEQEIVNQWKNGFNITQHSYIKTEKGLTILTLE